MVSKAIMANKTMVHEVIATIKTKNNIDIYNENINNRMQYNKYRKKEENTPI